jgi:type II secretory pathway pseudopilin PulG
MNKRSNDGFTLVEMAIIIIIVGVVLGATLVGKDLMHNAQLSSLLTSAQNYKSAALTFRQQYKYLPGDMGNADNFFSGSTNGNGDNQITTSTPVADDVYESLNAWHQLSAANIIDEAYPDSTASGVDPDAAIAGKDVPTSQLSGTGFWFLYHAQDATTQRLGGNFLKIGTANSADGTDLIGSLSPLEAAVIDEKIDDGFAKTGAVFGENGSGSTDCISSNEYNATSKVKSCQLWFLVR